MIAQHLETATVGLMHSICRLEREIDLLREYRTRLVADVVTGKLDVREAAARLPDQDSIRDLASSCEPAFDSYPDDELLEVDDEEAEIS